MNKHAGEVYGLWRISDNPPIRMNGATLYECQCAKCHNYSWLKLSNIKRSKSRYCSNCTPDYHFTILNGQAVGILPDKTKFIIDEEDVACVSQIRWYFNSSSGYITNSNDSVHGTIKLHRYLLHLDSSDSFVVDHINRVKTDCRKSNLRIATVAQNTLNKTRRKDNKSGYVGVKTLSSGQYSATIQIAGHAIVVGKSSSIIECAQMYNIASDILFGQFCGERNNVPASDQNLVKQVTDICLPYIKLAQEIIKPVHYEKELQYDPGNRVLPCRC